jgi:RNA polymerase sigma factor (TIGR02999 family)
VGAENIHSVTTPPDVTALLRAVEVGDREAMDELFNVVYAELKALGKSQRARWAGDYTLNTTALVHEAYLKLVDQSGASYADRSHFLAVATRAMRHILVNYAERRKAGKRGGGQSHVDLEATNPVSPEVADDVVALHDALGRLESVSERQARVVETRFFGGFNIEETAALPNVSSATVKRDWALASAWLHREIQRDLGHPLVPRDAEVEG